MGLGDDVNTLRENFENQIKDPRVQASQLIPGIGQAGLLYGTATGKNPVADFVGDAQNALNMNRKAPDPQIVGMDEGTKKFAEGIVARGQMTPEQLQAEKMAGVKESSRGLLDQNDGMDQAVARRATLAHGLDYNTLQSGLGVDAQMKKGNVLNKAFTAQYAMQNVATANLQRLMTAEANAEAARAAVLNSFVGGVGAAAGAYIGRYKPGPTTTPTQDYFNSKEQSGQQVMAGGFGDAGGAGDPANYNRYRDAYNDVSHMGYRNPTGVYGS